MIKSNTFFALVLSLLVFNTYGQEVSATWNHKIEVSSGVEDVNGESLYAYSTIVFDAKEGEVQHALIKKFKGQTDEKVTSKKVLRAMKVSLPSINKDSIDMVANTVTIEESNHVKVILSFESDGKVVSPTEFPEADEAAREVMYNLGVVLNQSVVTGQIGKARQDKSTLENKHLAFTGQRDGLEQSIASSDERLTKLQGENDITAAKLTEERLKIATLKVAVDAATSSTEDLDIYDAAQKGVSELDAELLKNEQALESTKEKTELTQRGLHEKEKEIEEISAQIKRKENFIVRLKAKYDEIK